MSINVLEIDERATRPSYLGWRGPLLAELALARVPGLVVARRPDPSDPSTHDFLVATGRGPCITVAVEAFSSLRLRAEDPGAVDEWRWHLDRALVRRAREGGSPSFLFLFDADTDGGRFLRLDTLDVPTPAPRRITVRLSAENAITKANLEKLIEDLQAAREG